MYQINAPEMSPEFFKAWQAAGIHLNSMIDGGIPSWLRAHPYPPFLEHLSFRLGNQLFFVRIVDSQGHIHGPGSMEGLLSVASRAEGHPCLMPMTFTPGRGWSAELPGWGLRNALTSQPVDPVSLVTDKPVEMTEWEVQDCAVQVVKEQLEGDGFRVMSWQSNPLVDPAIWFVGSSGGPEWVVVRSVRYPTFEAQPPANWRDIAAGCAVMSDIGHFASVALANADQDLDEAAGAPLPLLRGHAVHVAYGGLKSVAAARRS